MRRIPVEVNACPAAEVRSVVKILLLPLEGQILTASVDIFSNSLFINHPVIWRYITGAPNRCVTTPWYVARDHEVCREIKKKYI
jgi:hypothetical protein